MLGVLPLLGAKKTLLQLIMKKDVKTAFKIILSQNFVVFILPLTLLSVNTYSNMLLFPQHQKIQHTVDEFQPIHSVQA